MNFQDLYQKIRNIEEGVAPIEECGMPMPVPGQQDSVTMSVNMNGNGSGGIKDLMNILKNIEHGAEPMNPHPHDAEKLFGDGYENSKQGDGGAVTLDIKDITQTGDDMHGQGHEAPKVNGGGNPMQEALVSRLAQMYDEIKEGKKDKEGKFDPLKHVKNPTKGEKEAAKDVKRGSYADRAAMLKSAEADGRLKEGEKKTMSRAAKGYEKYGKEGMQALAKAGKEGKDLDKVRDKYNKYDEGVNESADILKLAKMLRS